MGWQGSPAALALVPRTINGLTNVPHIMKMRSCGVTAAMMRTIMISTAMWVMTTAKAEKARAEARTSRKLPRARCSRKVNQQMANGNGKDRGKGQPRA